MRVVNYNGLGGDWADHMEAKARLEATSTGIAPSHSWVSWKTPYLTTDQTHRYNMRLTTENFGSGDWKVHVRLIWHRPFPIRNVTKNVYLPFSGSCYGQDVNRYQPWARHMGSAGQRVVARSRPRFGSGPSPAPPLPGAGSPNFAS